MQDLNVECSGLGEQLWVPTWTAPYPPHGQGVFTFKILRKKPFSISLQSSSTMKISLEVSHNKVQLKLQQKEVQLLAESCKVGVGFDPDNVTSYWFSLNRDQLVIKYGKGYLMEETTLLTYDFLAGLSADERMQRRCNMKTIFKPDVCKTLELHDQFTREDLLNYRAMRGKSIPSFTSEELESPQGRACFFSATSLSATVENCPESARVAIGLTNEVYYYPHPLIVNWPFVVKESSESSLFELDNNEFIFTGSLPPECQELYTNIASAKVDLDWVPKPQQHKLSDAIRYSFETKVHEKLRQKKMKYIRVTVGPHRSPSPGIPYVLELWPKNHGSPVHCHGNSYGVIKVLHGGLRAEIYNSDMKTLIKYYDVRKGDVTWMSPYWYQCHRLFNDTDDFCATLQCYRYGIADTKMWPFFDYVNADGSCGEFLPDGDFTFTELNQIVLAEYQVT